MAELKAKLDEIDALTDAMKSRKDAIKPSVSSIAEPTKCSGIMVSEYYKRIKTISKLLNDYKQLLSKDIDDIKKSKETIKEMDKQMENLSKSL